MSLHSRLIVAMLIATIATCAQAAPSHVLVKSREQGQGMLLKREDVCYLLTAAHVVRGADVATLVGVGTRQFGEAKVLARFADQDLALLRVNGSVTRNCGDDWTVYRSDLSRALANRPNGTVPFVFDAEDNGAFGGVGRLPVIVTDLGPDWLRVMPTRPGDGIEQGRSGSLVLISDVGVDRAAGLLVSVEPDGAGKVLRLDRASATLDRYFASPGAFAAPAPDSVRPVAAIPELPGNLLAASAGAKVVAWNSLPSAAEYSPSNLIDSSGATSWNAHATQLPVQVDFKLAGEAVQTVGRVDFVQARDQPATRAAREYELMSSVDGNSWRSIHSGTLFADEPVKSVLLAPLRAAFLRLRIYRNWGDPDWVALRQLRAFRD